MWFRFRDVDRNEKEYCSASTKNVFSLFLREVQSRNGKVYCAASTKTTFTLFLREVQNNSPEWPKRGMKNGGAPPIVAPVPTAFISHNTGVVAWGGSQKELTVN